ncbi:MAG: TetR family transcriptional regulator [Frankiales bacterium]|jgi:AcrR family transcriptional regulator|nr:TetR family transcriptional regulator [Frankiales bacterium]
MRWAAHRELRREELIAAVIAAVRARGAAADMDDVTEVSGIAKPVFYRYFADKADLYLAVGREVAERIVSEVVSAADVPGPPRVQLRAGMDAFLSWVERDPDLYRFVVQRPATASAAADYSAVVGKHVSRITADVLRAGGRDSGVAETWGFAIVGAVRAAADRWLEEPTISRDTLAAHLSDLLWSGARSAPRTGPAT